MAASLWLVARSEQKWAQARQAHQPISAPGKVETVASPDAVLVESPKNVPPPETTGAAESHGEPEARDERSTAGPVQGRHRLGPAQAAVQMVLFFDYACPRCQRVEQDVRAMMKRFPDRVSLTLRHYPQSTDCNHTLKLNTHPNACQAARAAEAAGMVKGEAGFWKMHSWLFDRMGRFSVGELRDVLPTLGYDDVDRFVEIMDGDEPLQNILRDVLDAASLPNVGLGTMVMNGIQLESGEIEDALAQAVQFLDGQPPTDAQAASPDGSSPQGPFSVELLARALAATVQVVNVSNGDQGSGVMIATRGSTVYVLTADHLLPNDRLAANRGERLEIRMFSTIAATEPVVYRSVQVVARAPDDDVAVLRLSTRRDVPAPLSICPPQEIPADQPFPALSIGWGGGLPTVVAGRVSATKRVRKRSKGAATLVWELNKPSKPGQSGGPLIDPHGYVIGVASGNSGGHGYFCHTEVIHRLLEQNGLDWAYMEKAKAVRGAR